MSKADQDNRSNQLNPNNDAYWQSRGWESRPEDAEEGRTDDGRNSDKDKGTGKR